MMKRRLNVQMVSVLHFLFGFLLVISFVSLPILLVMSVIDIAVGEGLTSGIAILPIEFLLDVKISLPEQVGVATALEGGMLRLPMDELTLGWRIIIISQAIMQYALGVFILYILWSIFHALKVSMRDQENVFLQGNTKRIRLIGYIFIVSALVEFVYRKIIRHFLVEELIFQDNQVPFTLQMEFLDDILLGVIILVIAQIYRVGTEIKEEQKLTV
ncbi:MAG: DUF2975 domain-containing protein [Bacteroidota bacterium]